MQGSRELERREGKEIPGGIGNGIGRIDRSGG